MITNFALVFALLPDFFNQIISNKNQERFKIRVLSRYDHSQHQLSQEGI